MAVWLQLTQQHDAGMVPVAVTCVQAGRCSLAKVAADRQFCILEKPALSCGQGPL